MCRPSGRGCTVMPCAPASRTMAAARITLGMPSVRELRSKATLLRLTLSLVMRQGATERSWLPGRSQLLEIAQQRPCVQNLIAEVMIDQHAHQGLALLLRGGAGVVVRLHIDQRLTRQFYLVFPPGAVERNRAAFDDVGIAALRRNRQTADNVEIERQRISQFAQKVFFETAKNGGMIAVRRKRAQRLLVHCEQPFVRIVPRKQLERQLVEIESADQGQPLERQVSPLPLRLVQGAQFALARPADKKRLKCQQHAAQRRFGAPRAARHQRDAAKIPGKGFDNQAGFTKRVMMQQERRLPVLPRFVTTAHKAIEGAGRARNIP